ncbi:MAG: hypothetical protein LBL19_00245 [Spirochaetaceae bacterium]|jgi:hypothetical protein|nr:hypothetical protein [Spirochaetaceae bacterium]
MKRLVLLLVVLVVSSALYAQIALPYTVGSGSWSVYGDRLYQNDENARLAKVNIRIPQEGPMVYEFNARYESGGEDGHGGFGLHVFGNQVVNAPSWGSGRSYLLWLNYDENPGDSKIPAGLSAQVYRSLSNSYMELVESVDLNEYAADVTEDDLDYSVPFRILVDGSSGEVRVYDPRDVNLADYFYFYINSRETPLKGDWISLRTNGVNLSFAQGLY